MKDFVTIYYWLRIAELALVFVLAVLMAVRLSRRRRFAPGRNVTFAVGAAVAFGGVVYFTHPPFNVVWAAALGVLGVVAGFFAGRLSRFSVVRGRIAIRRSPVAPWLWSLSGVVVTMTLLFGTSYLFALAMLLLAFALGVVVGQVAAELVRRKPALATPVAVADAAAGGGGEAGGAGETGGGVQPATPA